MSNKILVSLMLLVTPLGFYRGVREYSWFNQKYKNKEYMYSEALGYGIAGSIVYICPLLLVNNVAKEFHRAEVDIRNITELKKTKYYNELL